MRYFLFLLFLIVLGGGAYYYFTVTEDYQSSLREYRLEHREDNSELGKRQQEIEKLIAETTAKLENPKTAKKDILIENSENGSGISEETNVLREKIKSKADLLSRKKALEKYLDSQIKKQKTYEQNAEARIKNNTKTLEDRRTKAYRDFEARMNADRTDMKIKGPRYAKEKRDLDAIATAYQNRVNDQNATLRTAIQDSREKIDRLERRITEQIEKIELLAGSADISESGTSELTAELTSIVKETDTTRANSQGLTDGERQYLEIELGALNKELFDVNQLIKDSREEANDAAAKLKKDYDFKISELLMFGGGAAAVLALFCFLCFIYSKVQGN